MEIIYKEYPPLVKELEGMLKRNAKMLTKRILKKVLGFNEEQCKTMNEKTKNLILQLKKDDYVRYVRELYQVLSKLLFNNHICCRFHESI